MPTVTLNKDVLEHLIGKKLTLDELKDRISMLGTDLEKIDGNDIVVEVFPNRPDLLSEAGFARALSSFIGANTGLREYKVNKAKEDYRVIVDKSVSDVRPYTACAVVKNLKFDDEKIREIIQLQEKLHITFGRNRKKLALGIYPLERISMPITYTARKPEEIRFRPLEADKEMNGKEILEKHPTGKEYAHLLAGEKAYPVFIDAAGKILSMPPIINSHETGKVTEKTKDVFIECSGFDFRVISQCLNILVTSLADIGGEIYEMTLEYGKEKKKTPELRPVERSIDIVYINKMLGLDLSEAAIEKLLGRMGFGYKKKPNRHVLIPAYRTDILHDIDIAEDVAIAYGYENFEPEIPNVMTMGEQDSLEVFKARIADMLVGMGFLETISYNLTNKDINNGKMLANDDLVELENSKTSDRIALRSCILPSLMQVLSENTNKEYPQELFEIGTGFTLNSGSETGVLETPRMAAVIARQDSDFTKSKQVVHELMIGLDIDYSLEKVSHTSLIGGRCAKIMVGKAEVGIIGEIHPLVLENFGIQMPVAIFELNLGKVYELACGKIK
jgi:phenylalanyl-tRNA synthetase beta chain